MSHCLAFSLFLSLLNRSLSYISPPVLCGVCTRRQPCGRCDGGRVAGGGVVGHRLVGHRLGGGWGACSGPCRGPKRGAGGRSSRGLTYCSTQQRQGELEGEVTFMTVSTRCTSILVGLLVLVVTSRHSRPNITRGTVDRFGTSWSCKIQLVHLRPSRSRG